MAEEDVRVVQEGVCQWEEITSVYDAFPGSCCAGCHDQQAGASRVDVAAGVDVDFEVGEALGSGVLRCYWDDVDVLGLGGSIGFDVQGAFEVTWIG